jgi:acyl carrier protein
VTVGSAVGEAVLPVVAVGSAVGQLGPAAPDVPEVIRRIWVDLLGAPDLGQHDDFFELGGHSLLGTKVIARIRDALGVDLPAAAIFEAPTIAALAAAVERLQTQRVDAPGLLDGDLLPDLLAEIRAMSPEQLREQLDHDLDPAGGPRS